MQFELTSVRITLETDDGVLIRQTFDSIRDEERLDFGRCR